MQKNLLVLCLTIGLSTPQLFSQSDLWVKPFWGNNSQFPLRMDTDPDGNIFWVGHAYQNMGYDSLYIPTNGPDGFIGKLSPAGDLNWMMRAGSTFWNHWSDACNSVAHDQMGHVYVGGLIEGAATFGSLSITADGVLPDAFVCRLTEGGTPQWVKHFGGDGTSSMVNLDTDIEGNVVALLVFEDTITFDSLFWVATDTGIYNMLLVKLDSTGDLVWANHFKQGNNYNINFFGSILINADVLISPSQAIYVTGTFADTMNINGTTITAAGPDTAFDIFVAKLNIADGSPIWMRSFGGAEHDFASSLALHGDHLYLAGLTQNQSISFDSVTINSSGPIETFAVWLDTLTGTGQNGFSASTKFNYFWFGGPKVAVSQNGDVMLGGIFQDSLIYGNSIKLDSGLHCMYILRYDPDNAEFVELISPEVNGWRSNVYDIIMVGNDPLVLGFYYSNFGQLHDWGNHAMESTHYDGVLIRYGDCTAHSAQALIDEEDEVLCQNEEGVIFANSSQLDGYQWLKNGVMISGATFDSLVVSDSGFYQVVVDSAGCIDTSNAVEIIQAPQPTVTHAAIPFTCDSYSPFVITGGNPQGGYYTGLGVVNQSSFNPLIVPSGANTIWYVYEDSNGCIDSTSEQVVVHQSPAIFNLGFSICSNGSPVNLATTGYGYPAGGSHSGPGVVGTQFYPSVAGVGTHTIFYTSAGGCLSSDSIVVTVNAAPTPSLTAPASICESATTPALLVGSPSGGTYLWNNISSQLFYPSMAGTGNIMVTYSVNVSGCIGSDTAFILVDTLPQVAWSSLPALCEGQDSLDLTSYVSPPGGTFSGVGVSNNLFLPNTAGQGVHVISYSVSNVCGTSADSTSILVEAPPTIALTSTNVSCFGGNNGTASVSSSGSCTYLWSTTSTSSSLTGLVAGFYTVTATDSNGCSSSASIEVLQPINPLTAPTMARVNVSCNGGNNGSVTANPTGGTAPYTFVWSTGATSQGITGLSAGTYTATISDANGCSIVRTRTVSQPAVLNAAIASVSPSCFGGNNGSATATSTGGTGTKTFVWSTGATTAIITSLAAGSYTVTVTDANGCTDVETVAISSPSMLAASSSATSHVSCFGGADGVANASGNGGTSPYTYSWSSGATAATASNLASGTHTVTVTDANGCNETSAVTITQPSTALAVSISSSTPVSCNGGSNGSATAVAIGGTGAKSFVWSSGSTSASATGLAAGTYTVAATDANGCSNTTTVTITEPAAVTATITSNSAVSCFGGSNGAATATGSNGVSPYTYSWSSGATTSTASGLSAATYTVTTTDAAGCTGVASTVISEPSALNISLSGTNSTCNGANDGSVVASISGGTSGYSYSWSTAATSPSINGLSPGNYSVTVTDTNGCQDSASEAISEPAVMFAGASVGQSVSCFQGSDGQVMATVSGGTSPFNFSWSNGDTAQVAAGLVAGVYTVTISDAGGCVDVDSVDLNEPNSAVQVSLVSLVDPSCYGAIDGTISTSASGGTGALSFQWSSGQSSSIVSPLPAGSYAVSVTDQNGCLAQDQWGLSQPASIEVSLVNEEMPSCNGYTDGGLVVIASGGDGGFSYAWSSGSLAASNMNIAAGSYGLTVTDSSGCSVDTTLQLDQPSVLSIDVLYVTNSTCFQSQDGEASVLGTGGTAPYQYEWDSNDSTSVVGYLPFGYSVVTVTDANGCSSDTSVYVDQPADLLVSGFTSLPALCPGETGAMLTATYFGGIPPYTLQWEYGETYLVIDTVFNMGPGIYVVSVVDANNCFDIDSIVIDTFQLPVVSLTVPDDTLCQGVEWSPTGGFPLGGIYDHASLSGGVIHTQSLSGIQELSYQYWDTNGCTSSASDSFFVLLLPVATSGEESITVCAGEEVALQQGTPVSGQYVSPFMIGQYLTAPDTAFAGVGGYFIASNVCGADSDDFQLVVHSLPEVSLGSDTGFCQTDTLFLMLEGYQQVLWSTGAANPSITLHSGNVALGNNQISAQVWDVNGCSSADTLKFFVDSLVAFSLGDDQILCKDSSLLLSAPNVYQNFLWNDGSLSTELFIDSNSLDTLGYYIFWVVGSNPDGCSFSDSVRIKLDPCDSIVGFSKQVPQLTPSIRVYPNPARNHAIIEWNGNADQFSALSVFNVNGELISEWSSSMEEAENGLQRQVLGWDNLASGLYFIRLSTSEWTATERLLIVQ